jgi:endonuclease YncB( thermonuclease family)
LVALAATVALDHAGAARRGDDWAAFDRRTVVVTGVIDAADVTVRPEAGGDETPVHLIGLDTRDMHGRPEAVAETCGREAAARLLGRRVAVRLEPVQTRDADGRLLAYLFLTDTDDVGLGLIRDGYAAADRRVGHTRRAAYETAENDARHKGRGLWQRPVEQPTPGSRKRRPPAEKR